MLICCSCTRYGESIKEIYIVPKNPIGFSRGSFRLIVFMAPPLGRPGMDHILSADTAREIERIENSSNKLIVVIS